MLAWLLDFLTRCKIALWILYIYNIKRFAVQLKFDLISSPSVEYSEAKLKGIYSSFDK